MADITSKQNYDQYDALVSSWKDFVDSAQASQIVTLETIRKNEYDKWRGKTSEVVIGKQK